MQRLKFFAIFGALLFCGCGSSKTPAPSPSPTASQLMVATSSLPAGTVGASYSTRIQAVGGTAPYAYGATGLPAGLSIDASTGAISGTPEQGTAGTFSLAITVTDSTQPKALSAGAMLSLMVSAPQSAPPPSLSLSTTSLPGGTVGTAYSATVQAAGGTPPYTFSAAGLPAGLSIGASTGAITGTPTGSAGTASVTITVMDSTQPTAQSANATLNLAVAAAPSSPPPPTPPASLSLSTTSLPAGTVGTAYSATIQATGGTTPYTFSATGLPAGLSISASTGAITGTPTGSAGTASVAITVTDSTQPTAQSASATLSLVIAAAGPVGLSVTTTSLPAATAGAAYSATIQATGGTPPYTFGASGLPSGFSLATSSGAIVGAPTQSEAGTVMITVKVADSTTPTAQTASATLTLAIGQQPWVHPGIVVSPQQLAATRAAYQAGNTTIVNQVKNAMASSYGSTTYTALGFGFSNGTSACGGTSMPDDGCSNADSDADTAYVQALLWYMTGNQTYATNAMNIMNLWSGFKGYEGTNSIPCTVSDCSNGPLQAAWDSERWPRAAEILYYGMTSAGAGSGWSAADFTSFKNMLTTIYLPVIQNGSTVNGNWDMSMIDGTMQIAVLTENRALMSSAQTLWLGRVPALFYLNSADGSNQPVSPRGNVGWYGQTDFNSTTDNVNQETCRDLSHTEYSIAGTMNAAETDWIQGGELYTDTSTASTGAQVVAEDRIVGAMNLISGFELQGSGVNSMITAPTDFCTGSGATKIGSITIGYGGTYVIGYNAYHNRLNVAAMQDQSGSSGQHGTANTYNWIQNHVLSLSESNDNGYHMALFEPLTHTTEVCNQAGSGWTPIAYLAQAGSPTMKFNATPSQADANSIVGLANGTPSAYTGLAAIVRFNPSGFIDAYDNATASYAALSSISYQAGVKYSFWIVLNIPNQTYDAYVTPDGGTQVQIASGYTFRTPAPVLDHAILHSDAGTDNVCSFNLPLGGNLPQ